MKNGGSPERRILNYFVKALHHRGPDSAGIWTNGSCGFAHTRLKILDLSDRANQPWTEGTTALVFNGEIFNHAELRRELSQRYAFVTRSDTEVLFRALQVWGTDAIDRLRGQFAFAFHDGARNQLVFSRDHAGICPLYIHETETALYFASEIKPLLSIAPCRLDPDAVREYLAFRYSLPNGRTLFSGIDRFPAATWRRIDLTTNQRQDQRYWRLSFSSGPQDITEATETFTKLFDNEVTKQTMGDVPVGLFLSGGIDSRAVLYGLSRTAPAVTAFTMNFGSDDPEAREVHTLESQYGFSSRHIPFAETLNDIEAVTKAIEEPFGDLIMCANFRLAHAASSELKVILSGEGGDEAFCGYDHQRAFNRLLGIGNGAFWLGTALALRVLPPSLTAWLNNYPGGFGSPEQARIRRVHDRLSCPADAFLELVRLFDDDELEQLLCTKFRRTHGHKIDDRPVRDAVESENAVWRGVMRAEIEQLTLPLNLLKQDRFCMSASIEGRVPLASREILDFAGTLPKSLQMGSTAKPLLSRYANKAKTAKRAFSLFSTSHLGEEINRLLEHYADRDTVESMEVLDWPSVERLRHSVKSGGILAVKQAMAVLVLMVWWRVFAPDGIGSPRSA